MQTQKRPSQNLFELSFYIYTWESYVHTGYTGTFDVQGYTIYGLKIDQARDAVGLIGCIDIGVRVKNVKSSAKVQGESSVGGVSGDINSGFVTACYSTGDVIATKVGGSIGGMVENKVRRLSLPVTIPLTPSPDKVIISVVL